MKQDPPEMFKALAAETRVRIIELLKERGSLGAKAIAEALGITPAAVSQHLKVLKQAGLVRSERKGYWIPYSVDARALEQCGQAFTEVCHCCGADTDQETDLAALREREKTLRDELAKVREQIEQMRKQR